ncbi:MAG: hypothetical protein A2161_21160 [Candidatus Schekmanbacteria bacterium RBG_13_48_7]|uniref:AFP-like domain-containing protein n=1 Tax=Candidatus Schekmanbacteria bacterium RBG_13_48_7 TaxID=1817878 RepID=A0A1F7RQU6_9BACT|nr:MAG: hypothetical protein A2161_21160 [Candidatus Schekmanbacteria bacterium RBG_13_48_7]
MFIGNKPVGPGYPVFIIAEIGINHNGRMGIAKKLIDDALKAGVDAVKFQKRSLNDLYIKTYLENPEKGEQSLQYTLYSLRRADLSDEQFFELSDYCRKCGILFLCTPWDRNSVDILEQIGVPAFKVSSADLTNLDLLEYLVEKQKPLILSTGMSRIDEIDHTVSFLKNSHMTFAMLHCVSAYPAPNDHINLRFMKWMMKKYQVPIGYSGHERGIAISEAAVAMGACIIERHFTPDRTMDGPDHATSLEFPGLAKLVRDIRNIEQAMGNETRWITRGEVINREVLAKSLVAAAKIPKGSLITRSMITAKSPGNGISPQKIRLLVGSKAKRMIEKDSPFLESDISSEKMIRRNIRTNLRWGFIVRFHDMETIYDSRLSHLEFHLNEQDIKIKPDLSRIPQALVVHLPEYVNDNLVNPASSASEEIKLATDLINKSFKKIHEISSFFEGSSNTPIKTILHPGGYTMDNFVTIFERKKYYKNLRRFLDNLDLKGIELLLENLPPLPWIFGGRWFSNIFLEESEIAELCIETGINLCFDVSHAALTCNYFKKDLSSYIIHLKPFIRHLHISDAAGYDGEGLQIGDGEINFHNVIRILNPVEIGITPEIWQGHRMGGEDFWVALEKIETIFLADQMHIRDQSSELMVG